MLTEAQLNRRYTCPCIEEGVPCKETFRYLFNLRLHIRKEHPYSKEGKELKKKELERNKEYYRKKKVKNVNEM